MADVTIPQGDNVDFNITVTVGESLYDLTDVLGIEFSIKKAPGADILIHKTLGAGVEVIAPGTNGVFQVKLSSTDTGSMNPAIEYFYEARIKASDGEVLTCSNGTISATPQLVAME
ncbi:MAG TPA: hypothetical protein VGP72_16580 [Planctomycetota bacterium]|jgi:hypothetical protein